MNGLNKLATPSERAHLTPDFSAAIAASGGLAQSDPASLRLYCYATFGSGLMQQFSARDSDLSCRTSDQQ
jgi:hypothetical protein